MRRSLFGYRRADVEGVLSELEAESGRAAESARAHAARADAMERALEETAKACAAREQRMALLETELELARSDAASQVRGLSLLGAELEELRVTARGRATRIRLAALREAAELSARARAVAAEADPESSEELLAALERAVERVGADWEDGAGEGEAEPHPADLPIAGTAAAAARGPGPEPAPGIGANGAAAASGDAAPAANGAAQPNRVSVDIGPFRDFSQLVSFEDAANEIGATGEISIRRFSGGRANIDVDLAEPVDLLRELEERCDLTFEVRRRSDEEIILDLGE